MKFSILPFLSLVTIATSAPTLESRQTSIQTTTDTYLFSTTITQFVAYRNAKNPATLDWTSDGCTSSPDNPFGFNFLNSCYRHDFGYRNYKAQSRFTSAAKAKIDSNFKTDMFNQCKSEDAQEACEATATLYYEAVKAFGKKRLVEMRDARRAELEKLKTKEALR